MTFRTPTIALAGAVIFTLAACGSNAGGPELSEEAETGRTVFQRNGCASCHGSDGGGGVGPPLANLWGEPVELEDGSVVTADRDYLRQSIVDPGSQIVKGYGVPMPTNNLTEGEIDSILTYIEAIGPAATSADAADGTAAAGRELYESKGCASCHGGDAEGAIGPALTGLWGSDVELVDGSTVVATPAYLARAITDPRAEVVAGFDIPKPTVEISDREMSDLLAYLRSIGPDGASS